MEYNPNVYNTDMNFLENISDSPLEEESSEEEDSNDVEEVSS